MGWQIALYFGDNNMFQRGLESDISDDWVSDAQRFRDG
jgi:hypothetical protein